MDGMILNIKWRVKIAFFSSSFLKDSVILFKFGAKTISTMYDVANQYLFERTGNRYDKKRRALYEPEIALVMHQEASEKIKT